MLLLAASTRKPASCRPPCGRSCPAPLRRSPSHPHHLGAPLAQQAAVAAAARGLVPSTAPLAARRFPQILENPRYGAEARELYANAQDLLQRIIDEKLLLARGVYGFWPAASDGDDLVLYADEDRGAELLRFPMLRQQRVRNEETPLHCLADFVAPIGSGLADHVGAFAVTAGLGAEAMAARLSGSVTTTKWKEPRLPPSGAWIARSMHSCRTTR